MAKKVWGFDTFDGKEALEMFEAEQPDILILDLVMRCEEVDGLEVAGDYS